MGASNFEDDNPGPPPSADFMVFAVTPRLQTFQGDHDLLLKKFLTELTVEPTTAKLRGSTEDSRLALLILSCC
jgi:hypothetical protein